MTEFGKKDGVARSTLIAQLSKVDLPSWLSARLEVSRHAHMRESVVYWYSIQ